MSHLYFHIPFCAKLCPYCSFYVDTHFKNKSQAFLDALLCELDLLQKRFFIRPKTIYFGGGTPSSLSLSQIRFLLEGLHRQLDLEELEEWTFEVNPATVSLDKARLLRELGVNRMSMGVQSWDDTILKTLGRIHTGSQAEQTFHVLREAGFENISLDLMFAVPGQSRAQWKRTLKRTIALEPEHISSYCLSYEEDTEFLKKLNAGELIQDEAWDADLFEMTMDTLGEAGFLQYEVSNYARPGYESKHNFAYWRGDNYLGLGPGAFSTHGCERWQNIADTVLYTQRILAGEPTLSFKEEVNERIRTGERLAFSLRTNLGLPLDALVPWQEQVDEFISIGLLQLKHDRAYLTRKGKLLADSVAEIFV